MSRASDWVTVVAAGRATTAEMEAQRPPSVTVGALTFSVTDDGGLHVHGGHGSDDLSPDEVAALVTWYVETYG